MLMADNTRETVKFEFNREYKAYKPAAKPHDGPLTYILDTIVIPPEKAP